MSWVVVVHTDPASTVALLEQAGLAVELVGSFDPAGPVFVATGNNWSTSHGERAVVSCSDVTPTPRSVLVVSNPAAKQVAA